MILSPNKILIFVTIFFVISGCVDNMPANPDLEFTLESFTGIYTRENPGHDISERQSHDILERQCVVYNLLIKNNGSSTHRFTLDKMILMSKKGLSVPTYIDNASIYRFDETNKIRLYDISLLPGQTIRGYVAFDVDSLYDTSLSLIYDSKPIILTSFENSVLALEKVDLFNYSIAMGKPPYHVGDLKLPDTYDPPQPEFYTGRGIAYSQIWSNWINRSVVRFFKELDSKELNNIKRDDDIPLTHSTYVLNVVSGKNFSIHRGRTGVVVITDENNEELLEGYYREMVISDNKTFKPLYDNLTISGAALVRMSFYNAYGWYMATRFNYNDQVVVLDGNRNIIFIGFDYRHMVS